MTFRYGGEDYVKTPDYPLVGSFLLIKKDSIIAVSSGWCYSNRNIVFSDDWTNPEGTNTDIRFKATFNMVKVDLKDVAAFNNKDIFSKEHQEVNTIKNMEAVTNALLTVKFEVYQKQTPL